MSRVKAVVLFVFMPLVLTAPRGAQPRAETGRIAGTVEISTALAAHRPRFRIYADAGPGSIPPAPPPQRNDAASERRNVVVYLESDRAGVLASQTSAPAPPPATAPAADHVDAMRHGVMSQSDERFDPHVLPVLRGAQVDFPNRDDVYHNVFSLSSVRTFDLGRYPKGSSKSVTFPKAGVVQVFCHIHSDMSALILVLANAFFTGPDSTGRYAIEDVPAGEYTVVGWHERTRPVAQRVRVTAGQTTTINFSLPLEPTGRDR